MTMLCDGMLLGAGSVGGFTYVGGVGMPRSTTATIVVDAIPGVIAGDILLAFIANTQAAARTITSRPSGFSNVPGLVRSNADGSNAVIDIKTAAGSEPSTYSWVWNNATSNVVAIMTAWRGPTGVDVSSAAFDTTTSATLALGSITPTVPGVLIGFFGTRLASTVTTPPSGMTARATTIGQPSTPSLSAYSLDPSPAGATGSKTLVWSASSVVFGALVQLS